MFIFLHSISGYNNKLFVGALTNGFNCRVIVIENKIIIKTFSECNKPYHHISIPVDFFGYVATDCGNNVFLFYSDQIFTGKQITLPNGYNSIGFDSKGQFIFMTSEQITIFH
jgi:hypothetical protein